MNDENTKTCPHTLISKLALFCKEAPWLAKAAAAARVPMGVDGADLFWGRLGLVGVAVGGRWDKDGAR